MKSLKFSYKERILIISILLSVVLTITLNQDNKKTLDITKNRKVLPIEKVKLNDRVNSKSLNKNKGFIVLVA